MHAALSLARSALRPVLDFALPPRCPGCGTVTDAPHRFCLACWSALTFLGEPCCARCALPFAYGVGAAVSCGRCLAEPPAYDRLRAAVAYGDVARKVALKLKYGGRPGVAETLARFMARHVAPSGECEGAGDRPRLLVPVPLHGWRIWKRGYNQAALIATALSRRTGIEANVHILQRVKAPPPLKAMTRRERALAVSGAFKVRDADKPALAGRTVILVDDVFT